MFSRLLRRTHLYLGIFLAPWILMYALSTLAMNHRHYFQEKYGRGPAPWQPERELTYDGSFTADTPLRDISRQILLALELDGAHGVNRRADGAIVITRQSMAAPRRLTYTPADRRLVIEKAEPRVNAWLERFHRRRGYATGYGLDTVWAVSVDLTIVALVFWAVSGLWMWWEMKSTRPWGAAGLLGGVAIFAFYVLAI